VREVRVIDAEGNQHGIMPTAQALQSAIELGIDLVEVAPTAAPPVCRLMDYGRFRYDQTKKDRESKKSQHTALLREMRFRPNIGSHDRDAKLRRTRELLEEGNKVKLTVVFRGREITHQELGIGLLRGIAESLREVAKLESPPNFEGRHMSIIVAPVAKRESSTAEQSATQETESAS
jgi:translation initiation factor IF-3